MGRQWAKVSSPSMVSISLLMNENQTVVKCICSRFSVDSILHCVNLAPLQLRLGTAREGKSVKNYLVQ